MVFFSLVAIILLALTYYIVASGEAQGGEEASAPADRKAPANRTRKVRDKEEKERSNSSTYEKKARGKVISDLKSASERAKMIKENHGAKEVARRSYFLAESLRKMFSSNQFFEKRTRFDFFRTAFKAAEDARNQLVDRKKKEMRQTNTVVSSVSSYVGEKYARHAVESALMIAWCAGGLMGKGRCESAREIFRVSVSAGDVQSWEQFGQVLRKESQHYMKTSGPKQMDVR